MIISKNIPNIMESLKKLYVSLKCMCLQLSWELFALSNLKETFLATVFMNFGLKLILLLYKELNIEIFCNKHPLESMELIKD